MLEFQHRKNIKSPSLKIIDQTLRDFALFREKTLRVLRRLYAKLSVRKPQITFSPSPLPIRILPLPSPIFWRNLSIPEFQKKWK